VTDSPATTTSPRLVGAVLDPRTRLAALGLVIATATLILVSTGVPEPSQVQALLASGANWIPLVTVLSIATMAVLLFPRTGVAILAGLLFPPGPAVCYAIVGTVLGASIAFGIGRALGRPYLAQRTAGTPHGSRLVRFQHWLDRGGLLAVLTVRFLPILPFGLVNYAFGATKVRLRWFVAGTTIGLLPSTVLNVFVGATATRPTSPAFLMSVGASVLLTVVGALLVRMHRKHHPKPATAN
jgi:uncharacterized membrane protein YdjX (TVP38/TMEM64 family)